MKRKWTLKSVLLFIACCFITYQWGVVAVLTISIVSGYMLSLPDEEIPWRMP